MILYSLLFILFSFFKERERIWKESECKSCRRTLTGCLLQRESKRLPRLPIIGTAGCTFDYFIMCQGKKQGRVGILDWNMEPEREYAPALFDLTLSEWLENYFKRIILGKVIWCRCFYKVDYDAEL